MKCVFKSTSVNGRSFKVLKNIEWDEFIVRFYSNDSQLIEADYHCTDRDEAINTGVVWQMSKEVNHELD